jgi:hypothetical protein
VYRHGNDPGDITHDLTLLKCKLWQTQYDAGKHRYRSCFLWAKMSLTDESDLPISIHGDELSEPIIVDDNGGEAIIIHSDDETVKSA